MNTSQRKRDPRGVTTGGQFATEAKGESSVILNRPLLSNVTSGQELTDFLDGLSATHQDSTILIQTNDAPFVVHYASLYDEDAAPSSDNPFLLRTAEPDDFNLSPGGISARELSDLIKDAKLTSDTPITLRRPGTDQDFLLTGMGYRNEYGVRNPLNNPTLFGEVAKRQVPSHLSYLSGQALAQPVKNSPVEDTCAQLALSYKDKLNELDPQGDWAVQIQDPSAPNIIYSIDDFDSHIDHGNTVRLTQASTVEGFSVDMKRSDNGGIEITTSSIFTHDKPSAFDTEDGNRSRLLVGPDFPVSAVDQVVSIIVSEQLDNRAN